MSSAYRAGVLRAQYAARDAAWHEWATQALCIATKEELAFARAVFIAGWEARKRAQYSGDAS
jgi:hypothetical protein